MDLNISKPRQVIKFVFFIVAISIPPALVGTYTFLYSQQTLFENSNWFPEKRAMHVGTMGSLSFHLTRAPLAQNILDLGAYWGGQEIYTEKTFSPTDIIFRFNIPENSYLDFTYNRNNSVFSGLRLSRRSEYPSISFSGIENGQFKSTTPIEFAPISDGWHQFHIWTNNQTTEVKIDNQEPVHLPETTFLNGKFGFRSSLNGALIDDVTFKTYGLPIFEDDFSNKRNFPHVFFINFILFSALLGTIYLLLKKSRPSARHLKFLFLTLSASFSLCLSLWLTFDFYFYSHVPQHDFENFEDNKQLWDYRNLDFEKFRIQLFRHWRYLYPSITKASRRPFDYPDMSISSGNLFCDEASAKCEVQSTTFVPKLSNPGQISNLIVFIGTSQTFGAGARTLEDTFFARTHHLINHKLPRNQRVSSINISISGSSSKTLRKKYESLFGAFRPKLVAINLSNNDTDMTEFVSEIENILLQNKLKKIETILIKEPISIERYPPGFTLGLQSQHKILDSLAKKHNVPVLDPIKYLNRPDIIATGNIWWDYVHLNSHGQKLFAEWLAPEIFAVLKK